jgi:hypothetical protein
MRQINGGHLSLMIYDTSYSTSSGNLGSEFPLHAISWRRQKEEGAEEGTSESKRASHSTAAHSPLNIILKTNPLGNQYERTMRRGPWEDSAYSPSQGPLDVGRWTLCLQPSEPCKTARKNNRHISMSYMSQFERSPNIIKYCQ